MTTRSMKSLKGIEAQIARLKKQRELIQQKQRKPVITSILRSMGEFGITPGDILEAYNLARTRREVKRNSGGTVGTARPSYKAPVKYRNPETGDTWTGRGRAPRWLAAAEAQGQSRESFFVSEGQEAAWLDNKS